jgi:hypothetical protein
MTPDGWHACMDLEVARNVRNVHDQFRGATGQERTLAQMQEGDARKPRR